VKLKKSLAVFFRRRRPKRLNRTQKRLWSGLEFLVRLLLLSIPLYLVIGLGISGSVLGPLQAAVAGQSALVLKGMGFQVQHSGVFITTIAGSDAEPFYFMINQDCTGWKSMLFLFALLFAVPGIALRKRLWGLIFGLPSIWLGNLGRVIGVVLAEDAYGKAMALMIHDYLWQLGLIALVVGIWVIWMYWAKRTSKKTFLERLKEVFG